jgi:hypothetical protein
MAAMPVLRLGVCDWLTAQVTFWYVGHLILLTKDVVAFTVPEVAAAAVWAMLVE